DIRILRDREPEQANPADQDHQDRDDVGKDRPLDEKFRNHDRSYFAGAGDASIFLSCGSTFWPGIARNNPAVITRSSGFRPLSMTRNSPSRGPVLTLRCSTTFSPLTTST